MKTIRFKKKFEMLETLNRMLVEIHEGTMAHADFISRAPNLVPKLIQDVLDEEQITFMTHFPLLETVKLIKTFIENDVDIEELETSEDFEDAIKRLEHVQKFAELFAKDEKVHGHQQFAAKIKPKTITMVKKLFTGLKKLHTSKLDTEREQIIGWLEGIE